MKHSNNKILKGVPRAEAYSSFRFGDRLFIGRAEAATVLPERRGRAGPPAGNEMLPRREHERALRQPHSPPRLQRIGFGEMEAPEY